MMTFSSNDILIRPVKQDDLEDVHKLSLEVGVGMTNFPADEERLLLKINASLDSFATEIAKPEHELYFFVMENIKNNKVIGCSGIESCAGGKKPFYSYKLSTLVQINRELEIHKEIQLLNLVNDYQNASELCSLFLDRDYRKQGCGRYLSLSRFLFMAEHQKRFSDQVIAEMRGISDDQGYSPFWKSLGEQFFGIDFKRADELTGLGRKQFIIDLMPKYPVYVNLLRDKAQAVIGQPHALTKPAMVMLEKQGFRYKGYIDIFDGGPTIEAELSQIKSVKGSQLLSVEAFEENIQSPDYLIATQDLNCRIVVAKAHVTSDNTLKLSQETAKRLQIKAFDRVRVLSMEL